LKHVVIRTDRSFSEANGDTFDLTFATPYAIAVTIGLLQNADSRCGVKYRHDRISRVSLCIADSV